MIFTSYTLINFWKDPKWRSSLHVDVEAIVGGTVKDGIKAFKIMFDTNPIPLNIVICLGINDIMKAHTVVDIVQDLHTFQSLVYEHSKRYKHVELGLEKNTCGICPLIKPPKCVTLSRKFQAPTPDRGADIVAVNSEIKNMNEKFRETVPVFLNVLGIRTNKKDKPNHRNTDWRKDELGKKLHLISSIKCRTAIKILKYFEKQPRA